MYKSKFGKTNLKLGISCLPWDKSFMWMEPNLLIGRNQVLEEVQGLIQIGVIVVVMRKESFVAFACNLVLV